ncbi:MAG: phosphotransferase [Pirellulaceae bacterium]|nr:phosphotransferase [Pirellulaceae bacterium]MDP6719219.1 phosphotransferase [Pirellulaceae bacterium]
MSNTSLAMQILRHFPDVDARDIQYLGNAGGFSGACLWKITTPSGPLCLREWPKPHPTERALGHIHGLLLHAARQGMSELPVPLLHGGGNTILRQRRRLYELTPWMPGQANYRTGPTVRRLRATMTVLARFHAAVRTYPRARAQAGPSCSPSLVQRQAKLERLLHGELDRLAIATAGYHDAEICRRGQHLLELFSRAAGQVVELLGRATRLKVTLQPCIRDIWHDHILFTDDEVTGLIDFGAMRFDNVSCDLARLIGSLVADNQADWSVALHAYETHQPLTADEHLLIRAFDQSGVLMSGLSWLRWICVEGKKFDNQQHVLHRLDENLQRIEHLCGSA